MYFSFAFASNFAIIHVYFLKEYLLPPKSFLCLQENDTDNIYRHATIIYVNLKVYFFLNK